MFYSLFHSQYFEVLNKMNKIPKFPQDSLNSETQASCYHLKKKTCFTGSYELELGPWTCSHSSVLRFLPR